MRFLKNVCSGDYDLAKLSVIPLLKTNNIKNDIKKDNEDLRVIVNPVIFYVLGWKEMAKIEKKTERNSSTKTYDSSLDSYVISF